jgi:hypothetical protein
MELSRQVTSLELSKQLKELGIKQESLFYYGQYCYIPHGMGEIKCTHCKYDFLTIPLFLDYDYEIFHRQYSAFTVAELGEMLPRYVSKNEEEPFNNFRLKISKFLIAKEPENFYEVCKIYYICDSTDQSRNWAFSSLLTKSIYDKNEANVRAKMLIYLLENKLFEV